MAKRSTNGRQIHNNIGGKKYKMVDNNYYEIDLDIWKQSPLKKIITKQFDIGRKIRIKLFSNKFIYNISDSEIVFYMKKGNENIVFNKCNVIDKNIIEIEITSAMVENSGSYNIEIHILSDSISTFRFELIVVETIMDVNAVTSTSEYLALVNAYKEYNELRIKLQNLNENVDAIVANVTNGVESITNSEIVSARAGLTALNTRLNKIENGERIEEKAINYYHLADGIKDIINLKEKINIAKEETGFLSNKGEIVSNEGSSYTLQYYDISNLNYVIMNGDLLEGISIYGLVTENDSLIEFKPVEENTTILNESVIDTKQAKYLIVNKQGDKKLNVYKFKNIKDIKETLENKILELNEKIPNEFIEVFYEKAEKGFIKNDGTISKNESSTYTINYYNVENIREIKITGNILAKTAKYTFINFLDEVVSYGENFSDTDIVIDTIVKVPEEAKYLAITIKSNTINIYKSLTISNSFLEFKNKIEEKTKDITEIIEVEKTEKGFLKSNGTISKNESSSYTINYYNVENVSKINLKGNILKSTAYGFMNSEENILSYIGNTTENNLEVNKTIEIPSNTKYLITTTQTNSFEVSKYINISEGMINLQNEVEEIKSKMKSNYWQDKTICIFGTSVPHGDGAKNTYPYMLGEILNCTVINEAVGGSSICCKKKSFTNWHNMPNSFSTAYRCFSNTLEEQEWVIEQMADGGIYAGNSMEADYIRSLSYEKKLIPYLDGTYPCPDLFILEHGANDLRTTEDYDENIPYELTNYYGAMNFIIKTIFEYQPQARVMIMGHYENQSKERVIAEGEDDYGARTIAARGIVPEKQQKVAEMWNIPIYKTWEYMGWSQMKISTKGKWVSGYWQENYYNSPVEMTMLAYNLPDQSHPHADKSGKANLKIAGSLAEFIENNIR